MPEQDAKLVGQSPLKVRNINVTLNITVKTVMTNEGKLVFHTKRQRPSNVSHISRKLIGSEIGPWCIPSVIPKGFPPIEIHCLMDTRRYCGINGNNFVVITKGIASVGE